MPLSLDECYIDELLKEMLDAGCVELHLDRGKPPCVRARGHYQLRELSQYEALRKNVAQRMAYDIMTDEQIARFEDQHFIQFRYVAQHIARFSVSCSLIAGCIKMLLRAVPAK